MSDLLLEEEFVIITRDYNISPKDDSILGIEDPFSTKESTHHTEEEEKKETNNDGKNANSASTAAAVDVTLKDFQVIETIGSGSYGKVKLVEKDGRRYALKQLNKDHIIKVRSCIEECSFPGIKSQLMLMVDSLSYS